VVVPCERRGWFMACDGACVWCMARDGVCVWCMAHECGAWRVMAHVRGAWRVTAHGVVHERDVQKGGARGCV
jgi:hypothetical protein